MNQEDIFYKAMLSRDYRFDGKFYVAVKTTGIYCRPICPAKPKRENVEFFKDPISAEKAGYRPCLRCHPEFSPDIMAWPGKSPIVQKALQMISQNAMFVMDIETFAEQLHVSSRHLRRLFEDEVGLSPKQVSDIHRLNFANKLIIETSLKLTEVAMSSGFSSLRRFNDAFQKRYHHPPRMLRKSKAKQKDNIYTLHISYRPPFNWNHLLQYFSSHLTPSVENVSETHYERIFKENNKIGMISVQNKEASAQLEVQVVTPDPKILFTVVNRIKKMFDLDSDPILIGNQFSKFPFLEKLWIESPGLRIARGWDPYEIAVGTILGQVVSVRQGSRLKGELVRNYGEKVVHPVSKEETYLFPTPEKLVEASMDEIKTTENRKKAIRELSKAIVNGEISLIDYQDMDEFKKQLKTIPGIGNWSAEYISLRALGDTNAYPKDDLVLKKGHKLASQHFDIQQIEPWKGYLAIYLWKQTYKKEESNA